MKKIRLNNTLFALVDDDDFEPLSKLKWFAFPNGNTIYAKAFIGNTQTLLHRLLLDLTDPKIIVDHKNGNGLDCQRHNLRVCTWSENLRNSRSHKDCLSGYKGVSRIKSKTQRWSASIHVNNRRLSIGYFDSPEDAARAYNGAAKKHFGEFARFNDVDPLFPTSSPCVHRAGNQSGYRGVSLKRPGRWMARIVVDQKPISLGYFKSPGDAARAYNEAAKKYHGEFAKLNEL